MMKELKILWLINRKNIKYHLLFGVLLLVTLMTVIGNMKYPSNPLIEKSLLERQATNRVLEGFLKMDIESRQAKEDPLYLSLVKQSELLSQQELMILIDDRESYLERSLALVKEREAFYHIYQSELYQTLIPVRSQNDRDRVFYQKMKDDTIPLEKTTASLAASIPKVLLILSVLWFPLTALVTSNVFTDELEHQSIHEGFPSKRVEKMIFRIIFTLGSFLIAFLLVIVFMLLLGLVFSFGDLNYPIGIYTFHNTTVPIWLYILIVFSYFLFIALFSTCLSFSLNVLTKNSFITFFISLFLYASFYLMPEIMTKLNLFPTVYLQTATVLNGELSQGLPFLNLYFSIMILLIYSGICLLVVRVFGLKKVGERK